MEINSRVKNYLRQILFKIVLNSSIYRLSKIIKNFINKFLFKIKKM